MKEIFTLGKHVIEKNYHRLDPVGQSDMCATCSTACKTSCSRKLAKDVGNDVAYIIDTPAQNNVIIDRLYDVVIERVESIPCDLKNQKLTFDVEGNLIEGELQFPWPMDWIYEVMSEYLKNDSHLSGTKKTTLFNPEEEDQIIEIKVDSYIQRK